MLSHSVYSDFWFHEKHVERALGVLGSESTSEVGEEAFVLDLTVLEEEFPLVEGVFMELITEEGVSAKRALQLAVKTLEFGIELGSCAELRAGVIEELKRGASATSGASGSRGFGVADTVL